MYLGKKEMIIGAIGTGGVLVAVGLIIKNVKFKKYAPKPSNENHIFRSEIGDEYADSLCDDLKEKELKFMKKEFRRYSE